MLVVVALLVVFAGCSGTGSTPAGPSDGTPSTTSTGTPARGPGGTPTPDPESFPPGTGPDGIRNHSTLLDAHSEALADVVHRVEATYLANRSGALRRPLDATVHFGPNVTTVDQRANASSFGVVPHESVQHGPTLVRKTPGPNGTDEYYYRYDSQPDALFHTAASRPLTTLERLLALGHFEYAGRTTDGGPTLFRFEADSSDREGIAAFSATVEVSTDGVVHAADGSYVVDPDHESPYRVEASYHLELDVGPPERPGWTDAIPRPVPERIDDGKVLALTNREGAALAPGTEMQVQLLEREDPIVGTVTLPERLGPGETVYLYAVRTDGAAEVRIALDRPTDTDEFVDLGDRFVQVGHEGDRVRFRVTLPPGNETVVE